MPKDHRIFVFGSNLAGRHGAGAALTALKKYGAEYGNGWGRQGQAWAIPTKDGNLATLPLNKIKAFIDTFINYANNNPDLTFNVTRVGCGLAGYTDQDIAPFFENAPNNCDLPEEWVEILRKRKECVESLKEVNSREDI